MWRTRSATFSSRRTCVLARTHAEGTSAFIEEQLEQAKKTLNDLEAQVEDYKLKHKGELPEQESSLAGALSRAQIELQANQEAINRAGQSKALLTTSLSMAESTAKVLERTVSVRSAPSSTSNGTPATSAALQAELDSLRLQYTEQHPDVKRLEKQLAQTRDAEKAAKAPKPETNAPPTPSVPESVFPDLLQQRERIANLRTELALASHELDVRTAERKDILNRIAALQSRMDTLPVREQQLTSLSRDYEIAKANYKSLLNNRLSADMATDLERRQQGERFTMIDPAQPPAKPFSPDRLEWSAIACVVSLLLALAVGLAREMKRNVLLGEWELPPDIAILGRITAIVPAAGGRGI